MNNIIAKILTSIILGSLSFAPPVLAQIPTGEINTDNPNIQISKNSLKVNLSYTETIKDDITIVTPKVIIFENNNQVMEIRGEESSFPYAMVQIAEMDTRNDTPEVIFESYSGGAHCCTMALILTKQNNQWQSLKIGFFDGGTKPVSDPDNNGIYEYITVDNRFLYRFSDYATSASPPQIWKIQSGKIIDATQQPQYRFWLKNELYKFWKEAVPEWKKSNGFWAGYVGWKALIGDEMSGWQLMLKNYDQTETYCSKYDKEYNCIGKEEKFPLALLSFLIEIDYLNKDSVNKIKNLSQE